MLSGADQLNKLVVGVGRVLTTSLHPSHLPASVARIAATRATKLPYQAGSISTQIRYCLDVMLVQHRTNVGITQPGFESVLVLAILVSHGYATMP